MKAKDTVMTLAQVLRAVNQYPVNAQQAKNIHTIRSDEDVTRLLVAQAENSFKAGKREVIDFIIDHKRGYYARPDGTIISVVSAGWSWGEWKALIREDEGIDLH